MASSGAAGGSVTGVVLGGGAVTGAGGAAAAPSSALDVVRTLPMTGATQLMLMVALSVILLVVGALAVGLAKRRGYDDVAQLT